MSKLEMMVNLKMLPKQGWTFVLSANLLSSTIRESGESLQVVGTLEQLILQTEL
jgi:hypothetical protein